MGKNQIAVYEIDQYDWSEDWGKNRNEQRQPGKKDWQQDRAVEDDQLADIQVTHH
jgi:hypothetical protein